MKQKLSTFMVALLALLGVSQSVWADKTMYIPQEWRNRTDTLIYKESDPNNQYTWSKSRSLESDNVIILWDKGYGSTAPNKLSTSSDYYVDINDLLTKAESFYALECASLGFWNGDNSSYKMMILMNHTTEWACYGGGYDYTVPALWLSPSTCKPVGSAVAHEVGHSFHYMCYSEASNHGSTSGIETGFHSNWSGSNGQAIWETTANWQALQSYPTEFFTESGMTDVFKMSHNYAWSHEWHRYAAYPFLYYLVNKYNDIQTVADVWNHTETTVKDFNEVLMDEKSMSVDSLYRMYYDYAAHTVTWDYPALKNNSTLSTQLTNYIGKFNYNCVKNSDGSYQVAYASCPQSTGFNAIPLTATAGNTVTVDFTALVPGCALAEASGTAKYMNGDTQYTTTTATKYNTNSNASKRGFRIGFVAYMKNGTRQYTCDESKVYCTGTGESTETLTYTVPSNVSKLWMVVVPAPTSYIRHSWDESISNDDMWPYKFTLTNASLGSAATVSTASTSSDGTSVLTHYYTLDRTVGQGYTAQTIDISADLESAVTYLGCSSLSDATVYFINESDGSKVSNAMANYDGWTSLAGDAVTWGTSAYVCVKFDPTNSTLLTICTHPDRDEDNVAGTSYTATWALYYNNKQVNFTTYVNLVEAPEFDWTQYTIANTYNYTYSAKGASDYGTTQVPIAADSIASDLGLSSLSDATFYCTTSTGGLSSSTNAGDDDGNGGYWLNSEGNLVNWGSDARVYLCSDKSSYISVGQFPGLTVAGDTYVCPMYFGNGTTLVKVNVTCKIAPRELTDYTIVGTKSYTLSSLVKGDFTTDPIALAADTTTIKTALGLSGNLSAATFYAKSSDANISTAYTANRGYFFNENGYACSYANGSLYYVETNDARDTLFVGQYPNACVANTNYNATFYLGDEDNKKLYQIDLTYQIKPVLVSDYTIEKVYNYSVTDTVKADYTYYSQVLDSVEMCTLIGVDSLSNATFYCMPAAGELTKNYTTYDGYYVDSLGYTCEYASDNARFFVETDGSVLRIGQKPNVCWDGITYTTTLFFGNETSKKLVQINLTYKVGVLDPTISNLTTLIKRALNNDKYVTVTRIRNMVDAILKSDSTE